MEAKPLITGVWWIGYISENGVEHVPQFLAALKRDQPSEYKKIVARLQHTSEHGPPKNEQQYRVIKSTRDQLAEFKGGQARIYCFFDGQKRIILTNGSLKKGNDPDKNDLARAARLTAAYGSRQ